jgi:nucleotide-binding universal stress UspA family protein
VNSIVVATDFSPNAMHAAHRAALIARDTGATRLELLHVVADRSRWARRKVVSARSAAQRENARARLGVVASSLRAATATKVDWRVVVGDRSAAIAAATAAADLLVVGAPATWTLLDPMLGFMGRLLRRARAPILAVRRPPASAYRRALVAVDLATVSEQAFARARTVAPAAHFDVVHAYRAPYEGRLQYAGVPQHAIEVHRTAALRSATYGMRDVLRSQTALLRPRAHVVHGHPALAVLGKERELDAELVIVHRPAKTLFEEFLVPSVTSRLLEEAQGDVLVVPD